MVAVLGMARRPFDGRLPNLLPDNATACDSTRRTRPPRAHRARRRARLLRGDVPRRHGAPLRHPDRLRPGQPLALAPGHAARHPLPDASRAGQAGAGGSRPGLSTSSSTCAGARRRSASGRASSSTTSGGEMLWIPVGFGHGFLVLSEVADFVYKCTNYYDPATEAGIRFDDPEVGDRLAVGGRAAVLRARRDRADCWRRSRTRCRSRCERAVRTLPHGRPAPRQPAHGAAGVAVRALGRLGVRAAHRGPRRGPRAARSLAEQQLADLAAIGLDWDGVRGRSRSRASRVYEDGAGAAAGLRVLLHAGRDPRERVGGARAGRASIRGRASG